MMIGKLNVILEKYKELSDFLASPDAMKDMDLWKERMKEHASLEEIAAVHRELEQRREDLEGCRALLGDADPEMRALTEEEMAFLQDRIAVLESELKEKMLPKDPNDSKDVLLEIRAGTGGEEASLFAGDLLRMYLRYAERHSYKVEYVSINETELGGVKEVVLSLSGRHNAYSRLKYESGVHRVQRVPETETQGRIQTSAATVVVLPDVDDVNVEINEKDIRIDVYRSSGAGGQHVNKTSSAIRITHIPTGIVVQCQDERSQFKNKDKAIRVLKSRLYDYYQSRQDAQQASDRKSIVGTGDRSERIRTYNFPQGRITDHRIGLTLYRLEQFLDGDLDEMIDALAMEERAKLLRSEEEA